jgi:hypothetical protein
VSGECRTIDDCEEFINDVARNRDALPYVPGSVQCVRPTTAGLPNSTLSGCAVVRTQHPSVPAGAQAPCTSKVSLSLGWGVQALRLGSSNSCFPDDSYVMQCDFAMFFNVRTSCVLCRRDTRSSRT